MLKQGGPGLSYSVHNGYRYDYYRYIIHQMINQKELGLRRWETEA